MPEQKTIKCPFCGKGDVSILYTESSYHERVAYAAGNRKVIPVLMPAKEEVLTNCPNCGKKRTEIQKRLKEGKPLEKNALIERMKAAGLDPTKFK